MNKLGSTAKVPVHLCNMPFRILTIQLKASICNLEEANVLNRDLVKDMTVIDAVTQRQDANKAANKKIEFKLEGASLASDQKKRMFLSFSLDGNMSSHKLALEGPI